MPSYRKRNGKWSVRIRKNKSHAICKTFIAKEDAIKWARESESKNDVANALKLIGGIRVRGCPVGGVGSHVNIWIIRNHDKYKDMTAKELGSVYKSFWTDSNMTPM